MGCRRKVGLPSSEADKLFDGYAKLKIPKGICERTITDLLIYCSVGSLPAPHAVARRDASAQQRGRVVLCRLTDVTSNRAARYVVVD